MNLISRAYNDTPIQRRTVDGYVNATAMCKANGKAWAMYWRTDRATKYLEALSTDMQKSITGSNGLVISISGGLNQGTWVHERVAVDLARWLSPEFAVWMDGWFVEETKKALYDPGRVSARLKGKKARISLQDTLFEHEVTMDGQGIAQITNVTYQIGWGNTAAGLRKEMNLPKGVSPRERMSVTDLNRLNVHETVLEAQVRLQDTRGNTQNLLLASNCGHAVEALMNTPILSDVDTGSSPARVFTAAPIEGAA